MIVSRTISEKELAFLTCTPMLLHLDVIESTVAFKLHIETDTMRIVRLLVRRLTVHQVDTPYLLLEQLLKEPPSHIHTGHHLPEHKVIEEG